MKRWVILALCLFTCLASAQTILIVGDSLTEGYGLENPQDAYPAQLELMLKAQGHPNARVINGGIAGSTTASGLQRVKWYAKLRPEIMILALGANDGLRGLRVAESQKNLEATIKAAQALKIKVFLAGMKMPLNYGTAYRRDFERMYDQLARDFKVPLLPFMLEGVGGVAKFNQADGIHPNRDGAKLVAANMLKGLKGKL